MESTHIAVIKNREQRGACGRGAAIADPTSARSASHPSRLDKKVKRPGSRPLLFHRTRRPDTLPATDFEATTAHRKINFRFFFAFGKHKVRRSRRALLPDPP
ncbi:Hypothetical predicted protein [Cloeon dipterum]|uniref:Uncharacterized protein n=1 Tax=Cloeon dipterum TaxID=197152 RepID=A0A8S1DTU2_9INSE|nr:Hypothetical predicted protein [Cloeon dipterum]